MSILMVAAAFCLFPAVSAWAYIDPGTGSYIFQITLAFFLGALFALKMFWKNVRAFIVNLFTRKNKRPVNDR